MIFGWTFYFGRETWKPFFVRDTDFIGIGFGPFCAVYTPAWARRISR